MTEERRDDALDQIGRSLKYCLEATPNELCAILSLAIPPDKASEVCALLNLAMGKLRFRIHFVDDIPHIRIHEGTNVFAQYELLGRWELSKDEKLRARGKRSKKESFELSYEVEV